jgi:hypothetical protein
MEINVNFVLFEDLEKKSDGAVVTRLVIIRECKDLDSTFGDDTSDSHSLE